MAEKLYQRINFENSPSEKTPLSAEVLNVLDKGIDDLDNKILEVISNKILWSGAEQMAENSEILLSQKVSDQSSGIVLVFSASPYDQTGDYNWNFLTIPKQQIALHSGQGVCAFLMRGVSFKDVGTKYLYIYDNKIKGNSHNSDYGTGDSGIKYNNAYYVLRYVIGI